MTEVKRSFTLEILKIIKTAQIQNGLRHGDYSRYRAYCTKRLQRIRKSIKFLHGPRFKKRDLEIQHITNSRFLELVLMSAERCWALSMLLKEDVKYNAKFHAARRLVKGAQWAEKLLVFCNAVADDRTKLEAESYAAWFKGNVMLEKSDWPGAREQLVKAKTVYEELGKVGSPEMQELCKERVTEIEPTIRYCNFSLQQQKKQEGEQHASLVKMMSEADAASLDMLKNKLDNVLVDIRKKEAQSMREISWRGQRLPIRNEATRLSILSANDVAFELGQATTEEQKVQLYDKIFIHYGDAIRTISTEISAAKTAPQKKLSNSTATSQADLKVLESLAEYITYAKLEKTIERNLMLIESQEKNVQQKESSESPASSDADKVVRLYEIIIENVSELIGLTQSSDVKAQKSLAAKLVSYKALRCFFLAQSYANARKWQEALVLFKRTQSHVTDAIAHHAEAQNTDEQLILKLQTIKSKSEGMESLAVAQKHTDSLKLLQPQNPPSDKTETGLLINNLNTFTDAFAKEKKLVDFPPDFEPIPCKPVLYDLAFSACTYPDLTQKKRAPMTTRIFGTWWG